TQEERGARHAMNHHDHAKAAAREGFRPGIAPGTFADTDAGHIDLPALLGDMEIEAGFCCEGDSGHTVPALDKRVSPASIAPQADRYGVEPWVWLDGECVGWAVLDRLARSPEASACGVFGSEAEATKHAARQS